MTKKAEQKVETVSDALQVLIKAADLGRASGIYDWESLRLIGESVAFFKDQANAQTGAEKISPEESEPTVKSAGND